MAKQKETPAKKAKGAVKGKKTKTTAAANDGGGNTDPGHKSKDLRSLDGADGNGRPPGEKPAGTRSF
jgi:hypothetical protein